MLSGVPAFALVSRIAISVVLASSFALPADAEPRREESPPAELRILPYSGVLPACDDPAVLSDIAVRFAQRESGYWGSPLALASFKSVTETGFRSNGASYIPRRYCRASALFNDGATRRIVFNVAEQTGFLSTTAGVTWCVVDLDRNHAFSPACHAAGP